MGKANENDDDKDDKPVVARTAIGLQKIKLEKLMKNPDKPVIIPERQKEKKLPHVPDFVRNVMGSSAGAGSGEFHVYRHLRRKEYARQKIIHEKSEKVQLEIEYQKKLEENKKAAEERTAKKRAKRLKKKANLKKKKALGDGGKRKGEKESDSDEDKSDEDEEVENAIREEGNVEKENAEELEEIINENKNNEGEKTQEEENEGNV